MLSWQIISEEKDIKIDVKIFSVIDRLKENRQHFWSLIQLSNSRYSSSWATVKLQRPAGKRDSADNNRLFGDCETGTG